LHARAKKALKLISHIASSSFKHP